MKLKVAPRHSSSARRVGYTLVELLVVISLIAILASLAFSATRAVLSQSRQMKTKTELATLQTAVQEFYTHYQRLPGTGKADETVRLNQSTDVLSVLLGEASGRGSANPAGIAFLQPAPAKSGRGGLLEHGEGYLSLVDSWGNPFYLVLDRDLDGRVPNPDGQNEDPAISSTAPKWLRMRAAAFSAGPDGETGTRDDIALWR